MKTPILITALLAAASLAAFGQGDREVRTWTSAEGDRTFEASLHNYNPTTGEVTVLLQGRAVSFPQDRLSAADIEYLQQWTEQGGAMASAGGSAEDSPIGAQVSGARLQRLDGRRYRRAELEKAPEYYILYYSASW